MAQSPEERYWARVHISDSAFHDGIPCREWKSTPSVANARAKGRLHYPHMKVDGVFVSVHRWAYEHWVGPIPDGYEVDHLCFNTMCSEPAHLEAVPQAVNKQRKAVRHLALVTHCGNGHPWSQQNTYVRKSGQRACRACGAASARTARARRRGQ